MNTSTQSYWESKASSLSICGQAWINGQYQASLSNQTFSIYSPIDNRYLANIASCNELDANQAVLIAKKMFQSGSWSQKSPDYRKNVLFDFAALIESHINELALLESLNVGKPISDALSEIKSCINTIRWTAESIDKLYGEIAPTDNKTLGLITKEPVGVVAAITPWNFPLAMACWKIAPALASGNSVILKPSEKSPLTAIKVAQLAELAGIPKGIFQVLPGFGATVGQALAMHNDVDCLVFTGSTHTAKKLQIYAGQSNMKRVWLEAGGKSPLIIFSNSSQLEEAAKVAAMAIGFNQGQVCTAASRLLVEKNIYSDFIKQVKMHLQSWQPNNPLNPQTTAGAIVDSVQMQKILEYIRIGEKEGAQLTFGGQQILKKTNGFYIEPTIFENVTNNMQIAREEIFGPVLTVMPFSTEQEAIKIANDSIYGLAAGIWTNQLDQAHRVAKQLRAGSIFINNYYGGDMTVPFGGFKQSGNGRDKSLHAFDKYTELKTTWLTLQ